MRKFFVKRGDRAPALEVRLIDAAGSPLVGLGAVVKLYLRRDGKTSNTVDGGVCTVPSAGVVRYAWGPGDTDIAGRYRGELVVDHGGGVFQTYPSDGFLDLRIVDGLA
jgi:hypothetical protein